MNLIADYFKERENVDTIMGDHGFAQYKIIDDECYIVNIYVTPEYRKTGIASRLAAKIEVKACEAGCKYLTGTVIPSLPGATESMKAQLGYGFKLWKSQENYIILNKEL